MICSGLITITIDCPTTSERSEPAHRHGPSTKVRRNTFVINAGLYAVARIDVFKIQYEIVYSESRENLGFFCHLNFYDFLLSPHDKAMIVGRFFRWRSNLSIVMYFFLKLSCVIVFFFYELPLSLKTRGIVKLLANEFTHFRGSVKSPFKYSQNIRSCAPKSLYTIHHVPVV